MTTDWKPKFSATANLLGLGLDDTEGLVVAHVDGTVTARDLSEITGVSREKVGAVLARLVRDGLVLPPPPGAGEPVPPPVLAAPARRVAGPPVLMPSAVTPPPMLTPTVAPAPVLGSRAPPVLTPSAVASPLGAPPVLVPASAAPPARPAAAPASAEVTEETAAAEAEADDADQPVPDDAATKAGDAASNATHLKLYRERFHPLSADERASIASTANGAILSALCFDPLPAVIREILHNPLTGPEQARLIAAHHQNTSGLEWLLGRGELMRDAQVQRLLWRNPQLNEGQLRRLTQSKRLIELWKLSVNREAVTQTRTATARLLRHRFPTASAEERVELIFSTEGRALGGLAGLPIDGKTTSLLCARTYSSVMLIQNIAHWSVAPPPLIAHLLKQPLVVRQPRLRALLRQHPNAPAHAKGE